METIDLKKRQKLNIYRNKYAHTSKRFRGFLSLMCQWKGAVLKLIWHDLLLFLFVFFGFDFFYIFVLTEYSAWQEIRQVYELICIYCSR